MSRIWARGMLVTLALVPTLSVAQAVPVPPQAPFRPQEVLRDELPDALAATDVTIVVEGSDEQCRPQGPRLPLIGNAPLAPHQRAARAVCARLAAEPAGAGPARLLLPARFADKSVAAAVAQAQGAGAATRYVALLRWHAQLADSMLTWHVEEAVVDTRDGSWRWHASRRLDAGVDERAPDAALATAAGGLVTAYLGQRLPSALLRRGAERQPEGSLGGRWETSEALTRPVAAGSARIVVVGDYHSPRYPVEGDSRPLVLTRVGEPPATATLAAPRFSVASLAVAPGTYDAWALWGTQRRDETRQVLGDGGELVLRVYRGLGNATSLEVRDRAWLDDTLAQRLRHAFLADARTPRSFTHATWFVGP